MYILDDSIKTNEGIAIGNTYQDMINTYGEDFSNEVNLYTYSVGKYNLGFIVQNDIITSIEYSYSVN